MDILRYQVPRSPAHDLGDPLSPGWNEVPSLPPFMLADGSGPAVQQTKLRVAWDEQALYARYDCEDRDAWGNYRRRDDPIWQEEAVELFIAPGLEDPAVYFEFEVSPLGVFWDGIIHNPLSRREEMVSDPSWDCPGAGWAAGPGEGRQDWWALFVIPWSCIHPAGEDLPRLWRANFYRIERPRDGEAEFSAWSPTLNRPADFHTPARFGVLELTGEPRRR